MRVRFLEIFIMGSFPEIRAKRDFVPIVPICNVCLLTSFDYARFNCILIEIIIYNSGSQLFYVLIGASDNARYVVELNVLKLRFHH